MYLDTQNFLKTRLLFLQDVPNLVRDLQRVLCSTRRMKRVTYGGINLNFAMGYDDLIFCFVRECDQGQSHVG